MISDFQSETLKKRSALEVNRLQLAFNELDHDIRFIANLPAIQRLVELMALPEVEGGGAKLQQARVDVGDIFEQMLRAKPNYAQIRFIHHAGNGLETVRVDQHEGQIRRVGLDMLQAKSNRDYYRAASQLPPGGIYYSTINLNRENGVIEFPYRPVLRVAMPIYDRSSSFHGIVIINLNFQSYMQQVLRVGLDRSRYDYYLVNEAGYFLFHPDSSYTFGFDTGIDLRAQHAFSELKDFINREEDSVTFRMDSLPHAGSHLGHFTKFRLFSPSRELTFGIVGSYDDIGQASAYTSIAIVVVMVLLTSCALWIAIRFSDQISKPIELITSATRNFANSEKVDYSLPTARGDEIGDLANTFLEMQVSIENHQRHLLRANQRLSAMNRDLEHFARVASHDLREPIQRIAGLASLYQIECANGATADADSLLSDLHQECENALGQLSDFREFSDITRDASLVREECLIDEAVVTVLDEFAEPLKLRKVQVEMDPHPQMSIYKNLVRVLYRNLVDNALKHAKTDGFQLRFTVEEDGEGNIVLGVLNTGSSIRAGESEQIFNVFSKSEDSPNGHGIGLAICKRIVDFHSGCIWAEPDDHHVHIKFKLFES